MIKNIAISLVALLLVGCLYGSAHSLEAKTQVLSLPYPSQGMNNSTPETILPQNQCALIENMHIDYASGYLQTRKPFRKYSNNVGIASPITSLFYYNEDLIIGNTVGKLMYMRDQDITIFHISTGVEPCCFVPYNSSLHFGKGDSLLKATAFQGGYTVSNAGDANAPDAALCLLENNSRIYAFGDTAYPDRLMISAVGAGYDFTGAGTEYYDIGFLDGDLELVGMVPGPYEYIILFKRGGGRKATYFFSPGSSWEWTAGVGTYTTDPRVILASENEAAHTWRGTAYVQNLLWIMDTFSPMAIKGIDATEQLIIDPESIQLGARIKSKWNVTDDAFCVVYPPQAQVWFFPDPNSGEIWVLHYLTGAWTKFKTPANVRFWSAYYVEGEERLYLGGDDGYVWIYDTANENNYKDDDGQGGTVDINQRYISATYDLFPVHYENIEPPVYIEFRGLAEGTARFSLYRETTNEAVVPDFYNVEIDIDSYQTVYSYAGIRLADKVDERLYANIFNSKIIDHRASVRSIKAELVVTSGAIELRQIVTELVQGRKER